MSHNVLIATFCRIRPVVNHSRCAAILRALGNLLITEFNSLVTNKLENRQYRTSHKGPGPSTAIKKMQINVFELKADTGCSNENVVIVEDNEIDSQTDELRLLKRENGEYLPSISSTKDK